MDRVSTARSERRRLRTGLREKKRTMDAGVASRWEKFGEASLDLVFNGVYDFELFQIAE